VAVPGPRTRVGPIMAAGVSCNDPAVIALALVVVGAAVGYSYSGELVSIIGVKAVGGWLAPPWGRWSGSS
jgi:hypothetical protein